ncbi:carboxypeptidase-like regulatory domain-containing protein [Leeuwenhoekiella polynyae]|uniref:Carboxypeptidase-like protein n=1 Tax=Leeuwenhoekiella polynyae TaxID=1550906 RepID=A0A4Q0P6R3_9FLAO|nr:carboxypeptidase-like regulatory domain-containing protein [Leeuwenhoekiella polynyae]RXG21379.1 carboxypeptidase-like protein [Leeuwenhoekiella polynyae]
MRIFLFFTGLLFYVTASGQKQLSGYVYSAKDSTALEAVSIYFDGTTIGTITNQNGHYSIPVQEGIKSPLVLTMMGYSPVYINNYLNTDGKMPPVYLEEMTEQLDQVFLETDPWTRERKLKVFMLEFLGHSQEALKCKIRNPEVLKLHYSPSQLKLTAWANEPLIIENKYLGYTVNYTLNDFHVNYEKSLNAGMQFVNMVYYEGFSFYQELKKKTRKKYFKNREKSYSGSTLHFMRSLAQKKLHENGFRIFYDKFEAPPYLHFEFRKVQDKTYVKLLVEKLSILYDNDEQSAIQTNQPFMIDAFGNHTPPSAIIMGGAMSTRRFAFMLPLDYKLLPE